MLPFLGAAGVAFLAIFIAEFGDKSQLLILAFATRHPALPVIAGLVLAASTIQGLSVAVGSLVGTALPETGIVAGLTFLVVAVWTLWRDDREEQDAGETAPSRSTGRSAAGIGLVLVVAGTFIVGELGDKTMLATFALAATNGPLPTWIGSTAGEIAANLVAVVVGRQVGTRIPARFVRLGSAALFAAAGALVLAGAVLGGGT